jgi:hypothetical protein
VLLATAVAVGAVYVAWRGFVPQTTGDYGVDFAPAMAALLGGHLSSFFAQLPTDGAGGSVVLRAPAAAIAKWLGGGTLMQFRAGALEAALACGAVGAALACSMRRLGLPALARIAVIAMCVLSPAVLDAVLFGHPEEALGSALCVGALLLAADGRPVLAGLTLGAAVVNKPWGLLAVGPVLICAGPGARRAALATAAVAGGWVLAILLGGGYGDLIRAYSGMSPVAHPPDVWWPLAYVRHVLGGGIAYMVPSLLNHWARRLIVVIGFAASIAVARRRGSRADAFALLALLMLIRCMLEPSNHVYYQLPFVIALCAWEARTGRWPLLAPAATIAFLLEFRTAAGVGTLTAQFVFYLLVTIPLALVLLAAVAGWGDALKAAMVRRHDRHRISQLVPRAVAAGTRFGAGRDGSPG